MSIKEKLECKIVEVGNRYQDFLSEGIVLIFPAETVMTQIKNYSLMVSEINLEGTIEQGDQLVIGKSIYKVTEVGALVNSNIKEFGHFTIKVEEKEQSKLPGTLYIEPVKLLPVEVGEKIIIKGE